MTAADTTTPQPHRGWEQFQAMERRRLAGGPMLYLKDGTITYGCPTPGCPARNSAALRCACGRAA